MEKAQAIMELTLTGSLLMCALLLIIAVLILIYKILKEK